MLLPHSKADSRILSGLSKRKEAGAYRSLKVENQLVDFCSNDYLGFAASARLRRLIAGSSEGESFSSGSTGSRLLRGHSLLFDQLEDRLASFHTAEAGLIFNSGYDANLGLISAVATREDTIIYDSLIHASLRDGIRLSGAKAYNFRHNEASHLEDRLKVCSGKGIVFVVVESIYSMDGDEAPMEAYARLCEQYGAHLIVDEAHATGVRGLRGEGLVHELGLTGKVYARVHTFGKALGCHGAIVLGSAILREGLINYSRPFIYTTALPPSSLQAIDSAYTLLLEDPGVREKLLFRINEFRTLSGSVQGLQPGSSPIQCVLVPGNENVRRVGRQLEENGLDVRPILHPTVPKGKERLRICIHAFNTSEQILSLVSCLKN